MEQFYRHHPFLHPQRQQVVYLEHTKPNSVELAEAYFRWGEVLRDEGELDGADMYFQKAMDIYEQQVINVSTSHTNQVPQPPSSSTSSRLLYHNTNQNNNITCH